jgi:hypothetical protein
MLAVLSSQVVYERLWDAVWVHPQEVIDEGAARRTMFSRCCDACAVSTHAAWQQHRTPVVYKHEQLVQ